MYVQEIYHSTGTSWYWGIVVLGIVVPGIAVLLGHPAIEEVDALTIQPNLGFP